MPPEAIVRVIAERDGWKPKSVPVGQVWGGAMLRAESQAPNYLSSRDALFPVIGKLSDNERIKFMELVRLSRPDKEWDLPDHDFLVEILTLPPETLAPLVARAIVESK